MWIWKTPDHEGHNFGGGHNFDGFIAVKTVHKDFYQIGEICFLGSRTVFNFPIFQTIRLALQ